MIEVYSKFWASSYYAEIVKYIVCQQATDGNQCTSVASARLVVLMAILPICFALFGVTLVVYSLVPAPARELWASNFKWLCRFRKAWRKPEDNLESGELDSIPTTEI